VETRQEEEDKKMTEGNSMQRAFQKDGEQPGLQSRSQVAQAAAAFREDVKEREKPHPRLAERQAEEPETQQRLAEEGRRNHYPEDQKGRPEGAAKRETDERRATTDVGNRSGSRRPSVTRRRKSDASGHQVTTDATGRLVQDAASDPTVLFHQLAVARSLQGAFQSHDKQA